jgi:hypothetical protein
MAVPQDMKINKYIEAINPTEASLFKVFYYNGKI